MNTALFRRYGYDSRSGLRDRIRKSGTIYISQQAGLDGLRRLSNQGEGLFPTGSCPWDVASGYLCPEIVDNQVTFDAGGNRTDAANAAYATGNRIQSFGTYTFAHDLDGNLTQKYNSATSENKQFEWSADGRLMRVLVNGTERVRYDYNASGVLVRRWSDGVLDRHFLWDQGHLLAELDGAATQRIGEYAYLPGADQPLALVTGAQAIASVRYLVQDETGNVIGLLNGTTLDQQVAYDDWGMPSITGSTDNRLLFKGLLWESNATGMHYMRARWYDPELGRFASEDPCGLADGTNLYTFAGNDAINGHDPSGCISFKGIFRGVRRFAGAALGVAALAVAAATGPVTAGGAIAAIAGTTLGSAVGAAVESLVGKTTFATAFRRNLNISGGLLATGVVGGWLTGGAAGVADAGMNGVLSGYVKTKAPIFGRGALTLGSSTFFNGVSLNQDLLGKGIRPIVSLAVHEFGHTVQFIALSGFGINPWLPYIGLGGAGLAGQLGLFPPGLHWDNLASVWGGARLRFGH